MKMLGVIALGVCVGVILYMMRERMKTNMRRQQIKGS